jgi:FkbM family methyltransferase
MKILGLLFHYLGNWSSRLFYKISSLLYKPKPNQKDKVWNEFCEAGGEQLRYAYNSLNAGSIIFDLGGFEGQWASDIYSRFRSNIYLFEVHTPYYNNIKERFINNSHIKVYNFGLASKDSKIEIAINGYSTSVFEKTHNNVKAAGELKKASEFILHEKIIKIDLMKINIEGGEYDLLKHLIETGLIKIIENIQVQFHDFVPNALVEMSNMREQLSITHYTEYKFDFLWENWKLKDAIYSSK